MSPVKPANHRESIRYHQWVGLAVVFMLVGGVGGWAVTMDISGAVIASGSVVVKSNIKKVQHPTGGVVGEINVRDGDAVKKGSILIRLDETITRANLAIIVKRLDELRARKARLEAERDGKTRVVFPEILTARSTNADTAAVMANERRLLHLRRFARTGQKNQLRQRQTQVREEIIGLEAQAKAKLKEIELIKLELKGTRELWNKGLMPISRFVAREREGTRVVGEHGSLTASIARAKAKIAETELQILQIEQDLASEVAREMRDIDTKIGEFVERRVAAEDQLNRIDLRAPQAGTIHQSIVHTVGGVISPGETIMVIVPRAEGLIVEAKVAPQDIDQIRLGLTASLHFSAFNQRTTPQIDGVVRQISADVTIDTRLGTSYYTVRVALAQKEVDRLGPVELLPGMPVEVFIKTGDRTVWSYLMKPLTDQFGRAFREQ